MDPYVGEIKIIGFNFAPRGWAYADGQLLAVSQNDALFSLYGTVYGGDGRTTFGLPDLRSRAPIHAGNGPGLSDRRLGAKSGQEQVGLTLNQIPNHTHTFDASLNEAVSGDAHGPVGNLFATEQNNAFATSIGTRQQMASNSIVNTGGNQPHDNMAPTLFVRYCVALVGIYPSRN